MNLRKKALNRQLTGLASDVQIQNLLEELNENILVWAQDPLPFAQKMKALTVKQQQAFFRRTLENVDDTILSLLEGLAVRDESLGLVLLEVLGDWPTPRTGEFLRQLNARKTSKAIGKAIRKAAFRLKSKGMEVRITDDRAPAIFRPPEPAVSEGFLGPVDINGTRMIWLTKPKVPKGIVAFAAHICSDEGIIEFSGVEMSRKNFHDYLASLMEEYPEDLVDADSAYCYRMIGEAFEVGQKKGRPPSSEFLKWQSLLGPIPPPQKPLIYRFLSAEEVNTHLKPLGSAALLWETPLFRNWLLRKEECQKYMDLLQEAAHSRLVLTPYQKESRMLEIYPQAIRELFNPQRRYTLRRALEENAYILWKKGKTPEARVCLAMADGLEADTGVLSSHPFLEELVKRSIAFYWVQKSKEETKDVSLIIRP